MKALAALPLAIMTLTPAQPAHAPLDVVLLIDVSDSVTHPGFFKTDRDLVPEAAAALANALEPADRVRLGTFGTTIAIAPDVLTGPAAIARAASALSNSVGGPSPVWDAIAGAASALDGAAGRRGIVVITDGRSGGNRILFLELLRRLERNGLAVFVVALDVKRPPLPDPTVRLRKLADDTGGRYFLVKRGDVEDGVKHAVAALRNTADPID